MAEANRIKALYDQTVISAMMKKFNYENVNQVPKLVKITINSGLGDIKDNAKSIQLAQKELEQEHEKLETVQVQSEAQQAIATKVKEQEQENEKLKTESKKGDGLNSFNAGINRLQNASKKGQERNSEDCYCGH